MKVPQFIHDDFRREIFKETVRLSLSLSWLANESKVSYQRLYRWSKGSNNLNDQELLKLNNTLTKIRSWK